MKEIIEKGAHNKAFIAVPNNNQLCAVLRLFENTLTGWQKLKDKIELPYVNKGRRYLAAITIKRYMSETI